MRARLWPWAAGFVLGTLLLVAWHVFQADRQVRAELLHQARILATGMPAPLVDRLTASPQDLENPLFLRFAQLLRATREFYPRVRSLYLMRRQPDGTVVFLAAVQQAGDPDAITPGQPYPEASADLRRVLEHGVAVVEGPLGDGRGEWVSALVPLATRHPTLLGMDVPAAAYRDLLLRAALAPAFLSAVGFFLFAAVFRWAGPRREATLAAILGLTLTLQAATVAWVVATDHRREAQLVLAATEAQRLAAVLQTGHDHLLGSLEGLYTTVPEVAYLHFFAFTRGWRHLPGVDFAGFVPKGTAVLAPATEPSLVGLDTSAIPEFVAAQKEALRTDLPSAALVPFFGRPTPTLVLFQSVWQGSRFQGFACVGIDLGFLARSATPGLQLALAAAAGPEPPGEPITIPVLAGDQVVAFRAWPTEAFLALHPLHGPAFNLVAGLVVSALAARLVHGARRKREILEALVARRTRQLLQSLRRLQALFDNSLAGIAVHELVRDRQGVPATYRYLEVNPAFGSQTGLDPAAVVGKTAETALGVAEPPYLATYAQVVDTGQAVSFATYFAPLGRHYLVNAFPLGEQDTFATVFLDTTAWHRAEAALRQQAELLRTLLDALPLPVFIKDRQGRYLAVNPAFCAFFGGAQADYLGKTVVEAFPEAMAVLFQGKDDELWASGGTQTYAATLTRADGSARRILFHKRTVLDAQGQAAAMVGAMTDITEQEEAAQRLREANTRLEEAVERIARLASEAEAARQAKGRVLAMLSHDLRAPAAGALAAARLLTQQELPDAARSLVEGIRSGAQAALDLLEDALLLESLDQGGITIQPRPADLGQVVADAVANLEPLAQAKDLSLEVQVPALPLLEFDPRRVRQILANFVSNAVKFTPAGGRVAVAVAVLEEGEAQLLVELRVTDTGPGIAAERQACLFRPFGQVCPECDGESGVGLGLALCKELTLAMGGDIGVDSAPGQGASFWVRLPLARAAVAAQAAAPRRVLVAEDDPVNRTVVLALLARAGVETQGVEDGQAALATLTAAAQPFDAAILDLQMPGADGFTVARRIRQGHAGAAHAAMALVALTASDTASHACAEAGFDAYLVKPVDAAALLGTLERVITSRTSAAV